MDEATSNYFVKREICPVCRSNNLDILIEEAYGSHKLKSYLNSFYDSQGGVEHQYLKHIDYKLISCLNCQLVFQENIPGDYLMFKLYEEWIDPEIVMQEQEKYPLWYYENYSNQLINLINFFKKDPYQLTLLDYGMGWGKWCLMAKAFGCEVYGIELSNTRINYAKNNALKILAMEKLGEYKFDFINIDQVLEHIPDPLYTLKFLEKSLKSGGIIKVSVPNGDQILNKIKSMDWTAPKGSKYSINQIAPLEHINCFRTDTIIYMAERSNLNPIQMPKKYFKYRSKKEFVKNTLKINKKENSPSISMFFQKK